LELVLLARRELRGQALHGQLEEVHQHAEALFVEAREVRRVELRVALGRERGEEGVLARGEGQAFDILRRDGLAVEQDLALVVEQAQHTLHYGGLARAVLTEEADELALT